MKFKSLLILLFNLVHMQNSYAQNGNNSLLPEEDAVEITDSMLADTLTKVTYEGYGDSSVEYSDEEVYFEKPAGTPLVDNYFSDTTTESRLNKSRFDQLMRKFDYAENPYKKKEKKKVEKPVKDSDWIGRKYIKYALFILAIATLFVLIYLLFREQKFKSRISLLSQDNLPIVFDKDTGETDFERMLDKAINEGNYRMCIRAQYLIVLRTLSDLKFIEWKKDKTNHDYLQETKHRSWNKNFKTATYTFEKVWYGDWPLNSASYSLMEPLFAELNVEIRKEERA